MRENPTNRFCLSQKERLSQRARIRTVFSEGKKVTSFAGSLFVLFNDLPYVRFLCTFKRGFAQSVERNRMRRLCKEVYRKNKHRVKKGFDIVFLAFKYCNNFSECKNNVLSLFKMAGIVEMEYGKDN